LSTAAIEVVGVAKSFSPGIPVLKDVHLKVAAGEMVALIGASGSGKSTLIRAIAGLINVDRPVRRGDTASGGRITILSQPMQEEGRITASAANLRARIGVVFQQFNLVPRLSVLTNVCLGLLGQIPGWRGTLARFTAEEQRHAMQALARVGIAEHALKRGSELSGGQQQRAAIARTLVQGASVLIADEPIASLDPKAARRVMDILAELNRQDRITVLVSLHQVEYALSYCPRTIALRDGRIVYDGPSSALNRVFLSELYGAESEELVLPAGAADAAPSRTDGGAAESEPRPVWHPSNAAAAQA
jgi:phosphonate transport system ATP-binding protein